MRIYANFWSLLNKILLIVTIDGIISVGLCYFYLPRRKYTLNAEVLTGHYNQRLLLAAGLLLGTSLAGFIDGILFHQNY